MQQAKKKRIVQREFIARISSRGGVHIPVEVLRRLRTKPLGKIIFQLSSDGVQLLPSPASVTELGGIVKPIAGIDIATARQIAHDEIAERKSSIV